jgi:putative membrane protein
MNYKKTLVLISVIFFLAMPAVLFADDDKHSGSVEDVLKAIRQEQNVTQNKDINADKVSDKLLEELGEAVMSLRVPDERQHEWMDNMMGGEGSESLRAAHMRMGYAYLTGGFRGRGMSGGGMMMGAGWDRPMMGGDGWGMRSFMGGPWGVVLLIVAVTAIGGAVIFAVARARRTTTTDDPLAILKTRLAKGEITKEEYDTLKHDVT